MKKTWVARFMVIGNLGFSRKDTHKQTNENYDETCYEEEKEQDFSVIVWSSSKGL